MKNIIYLFSICLVLFSCKKEDIILFDAEDAGIYFQQGIQTRLFINAESYYDSTAFSFSTASQTTTDTILNVRIRTMGKTKNYDRPIKLSVDAEHTTAIEGKHFNIDLTKAVIPANSSQINFPVQFYRTEDMINNYFTLNFKLEENEHFKIHFQTQKNTNVHTAIGEKINADQFKFAVGEIYTQPSYWTTFGNQYFGNWTVKKFKYLNSILNWRPDQWERGGYPESPVQLGRFATAAITVRNALQELSDANTPMRDEDGNFMQMGNNYKADYSKHL